MSKEKQLQDKLWLDISHMMFDVAERRYYTAELSAKRIRTTIQLLQEVKGE